MSDNTGSVYQSGQRGQQFAPGAVIPPRAAEPPMPPGSVQYGSDATQVYPEGYFMPGAQTFVAGMPQRQPGAALYDQMTDSQGIDPLAGATPAESISDGYAPPDPYSVAFPVGTQYIAFRVTTKFGVNYFGVKRPVSDYDHMSQAIAEYLTSETDVFQLQMTEGVVFVPRENVATITIFSCDYVENLRNQEMEDFKVAFNKAAQQKPIILPYDPDYRPMGYPRQQQG